MTGKNMSILVWNDSLSVKIPKFDEEHRVLIKLINDLHDTSMYKGEFSVIPKTLKSLVEYAQKHFKHEEMFMEKYSYEELNLHKEEHRRFIAKITMMWCVSTLSDREEDKKFVEQLAGFNENYQKQRNTSAAYVQNFLVSWITNHVKKTDAKYGAALYGKNPDA